MKAVSSLVCAVIVCLCASATAQLECEGDTARFLELLQSPPTPNCKDQMLALIRVQDYVEEAETVFQALVEICEPVCLEYVRTVAQECIPLYVPVLGLACGKNEQSAFCYQTVALNNGTFLLYQCFPESTLPNTTGGAAENTIEEPLTPEPSSNTTEAPVTSRPPIMCSNACRSALEEFRALQGCCVTNAFNTTAFGLQDFGIANYSLWRACEVDTIMGACPSPFVDTTSAPTASSYILTAHGVLSLLAVLMAFVMIA